MATATPPANANAELVIDSLSEEIVQLCQKHGVKHLLFFGVAGNVPFMTTVGDEIMITTAATNHLGRINKERADFLGLISNAPLRRTGVNCST